VPFPILIARKFLIFNKLHFSCLKIHETLIIRRNVLESLVEESKILGKLKNNSEREEEKRIEDKNLAITILESIMSKRYKNLINIFRLENEEEEQDFELTILRSFLNSKIKFFQEKYIF